MTDPIDYSRPVGWWCPVCHMQWAEWPNTLIRQHTHAIIPVYLPLPVPEPVEVDEVETGEAEVVTSYSAPSPSTQFTVVTMYGKRETVLEGMDLGAVIAAASANARKKREEAK